MTVAVGSHSCRKLPAISGEKCPAITQTAMVGICAVWSVQTLAVAFMTFAIKADYWTKALKKPWALSKGKKVDPKNSTCRLAENAVNPW